MFLNVCAISADGQRYPTKKSIKEALRDHPETIFFEKTDAFDTGVIAATSIPDDVVLVVVGPDAFRDRRYYANVRKSADGSLKLS